MEILYSSSDSYAFLTGISMLSLMEHNTTCKEINIYIMDNKISERNKKKLKGIADSFGRNLCFVQMPDLKKMTGQEIETGRWNISTFGRLYMASALPETVHKVLNIDCDTIITDSIEPLWATDLAGKIFGGMCECINDRYRRNIGMKRGEPYLNGGLVFMNCDEVRKLGFEEKFSEYIGIYGSSLAYLDQDVLNSVVPTAKKAVLPMRYNVLSIYFYANYRQVDKIRRAKNFYSEREFEQAVQNPGLIHFTTCFLDGLRPWIEGNRHPCRDLFLQYKEKSPWSKEPMWEDKRPGWIKIRSALIKHAPKALLFWIASILHGVVVPNRNLRRMKCERMT